MKDFIIIAAFLSAASGLLGYWAGDRDGSEKVQAEWTADKLTQSEAARAREHELQVKLAKQEKKQYENEQKQARITADLRASNVGLRNVIASRASSDDSPGSIAEATSAIATYRELFSECTAEYGALAERADQVNLIAHGLQGYVSAMRK